MHSARLRKVSYDICSSSRPVVRVIIQSDAAFPLSQCTEFDTGRIDYELARLCEGENEKECDGKDCAQEED